MVGRGAVLTREAAPLSEQRAMGCHGDLDRFRHATLPSLPAHPMHGNPSACEGSAVVSGRQRTRRRLPRQAAARRRRLAGLRHIEYPERSAPPLRGGMARSAATANPGRERKLSVITQQAGGRCPFIHAQARRPGPAAQAAVPPPPWLGPALGSCRALWVTATDRSSRGPAAAGPPAAAAL